ncbi:fimbrial protein [Enterobacter kobei]|uniref:fimbrial protein n=1 Tax=Enterobacter kobei TaxID=208224 RepID=UPI003BCCE3EB
MRPQSLRLCLTASTLCLVALLCAGTAAQNGNVAFEGAITEQACAVSSPSNAGWHLPDAGDIQASLNSDVHFDLSIEVCASHVFEATVMNLLGNPDDTDGRVLALARGPGAAAGFGIAVYDRPGNIIPPGHPFPDEAFFRIGENEVSLPLRARYTETRNFVIPGKISSHAVIAVEHD